MTTAAMEDYLKAIYKLQEGGEHPSTKGLADRLGITPASATNMVKRLAAMDLVAHEPYKGVHLTEGGKQVALEVIRHHRLLELFLVETLGLSWDQVHEEAEILEHHISEELEARIAEVLGHPERDPHGDPIPDLDGQVQDIEGWPLTEGRPGDTVRILRVVDQSPDTLRFLAEAGLVPEAQVQILDVVPSAGTAQVRIDGEEVHLGLDVAASIRVTRHENDTEEDQR